MTDTITPLRWKLTWHGDTWTEDDLTVQVIAQLALISGDDRFDQLLVTEDEMASYPALGYMRLVNLLSAFVSVVTMERFGSDQDELAAALEEIQRSKAEDVLASLSFY
jgi:hypothetical protein